MLGRLGRAVSHLGLASNVAEELFGDLQPGSRAADLVLQDLIASSLGQGFTLQQMKEVMVPIRRRDGLPRWPLGARQQVVLAMLVAIVLFVSHTTSRLMSK